MRLSWLDLLADFGSHDPAALLDDWRWLVGAEYVPLLVSAAGDLFLQSREDGRVYWLDVGAGSLSPIADDFDSFKQEAAQPENANNWLMANVVGDLLEEGQTLDPGQCFSYKHPPVLGGKYVAENFEPTDLLVHFSVFGQIHRQVKDLPEGTVINGFRTDYA